MENLDKLIPFLPLIAVCITSFFGIIVALLTWSLSTYRERRRFEKDFLLENYKYKENVYMKLLASLHKSIYFTEKGKNYESLLDESAMNFAQVRLISSPDIVTKYEDVSRILFYWSSEYRKSLPTKLEGSNLSMVSSNDFEHKEKADQIFPQLEEAINSFIEEVKKELKELKSHIK